MHLVSCVLWHEAQKLDQAVDPKDPRVSTSPALGLVCFTLPGFDMGNGDQIQVLMPAQQVVYRQMFPQPDISLQKSVCREL